MVIIILDQRPQLNNFSTYKKAPDGIALVVFVGIQAGRWFFLPARSMLLLRRGLMWTFLLQSNYSPSFISPKKARDISAILFQ